MLPSDLGDLAQYLNVSSHGSVPISGFAIDSRKAVAGDLFVALVADRDGHDYINSAAKNGAVAALVSKPTDLIPSICVENTERALGDLAHSIRATYQGDVFALTGSQGKTSTRGFLASILRQMAVRFGYHDILVTEGNLNNHLGVPLTMARLRPHHPFALFELGASAIGEVANLAAMVRPIISALLNARNAHLQGFGSIDGVIRGKGEIIDYTDPNGTVVLNSDEPTFDCWLERAGNRKVISIGRKKANVCWSPKSAQQVSLQFDSGKITVCLPTLGYHFMENAAAASAMALAAGATADEIHLGLETAVIEPGRMTPRRLGNCLLIDDTYNANPDSTRAAIDWLSKQGGMKILVVGGLSELGDASYSEMKQLGAYAKEKGIDRLIATGLADPIADGFGQDAVYVRSHDEVSDYLQGSISYADVILVKGSRSAQMDRVIDALILKQGRH
ncbi:MAG: UDP-N-acetylmuramyl pentapeptide synthase [Gammaproteobacteria bacterium]|nr:UDP-N-acetylmuramyl pentapeptide synthase [Gammaproteobacteria bacterium]HAN79969.1 UDP-N-acetylmuramoyl-tripeptide--D-alanyl-D-alanine ligase [Gammaproteobacteria bacterium]